MKIEVKIAKAEFGLVMFIRIVVMLFIAGILAGCSEKEGNHVAGEDVRSEAAHALHDSTADVAESIVPAQLPVVNRARYHTIEIRQMKFHPQELIVASGDTVVWVNNGITAHDVTAQPDPKWTSASMPVGASWSMIVTEPSEYYCSIHVVMKGQLVVK